MSGERSAFNPRVIAAVVAAGILGFAAFMLLQAYADQLGGGGGAERAHALSGSAVGYKGVVRLIELGGGKARLVRSAAELDTEDLVVVTLEERSQPHALKSLLERRGPKPTLVVLPKWIVTADRDRPGRVRRVAPYPPVAFSLLLEALGGADVQQKSPPVRTAAGTGFLEGFSAPLPGVVQTIAAPGLQPQLVAGKAGAVLARVGDRPLFVLADPDLLNNQGLKEPAGARAALALVAELSPTGAEAVAFDLTLNGFAHQQSPLRLAFEPPFLPLTIALFLAALLAGLHGAFRFGPAAREPRAIAFGKGALVENSAGLFRIARREHRAGGPYAELVREGAANETGAHLALRDAELDAYLDRLTPPAHAPFSELAARARGASDRFELIEAARALFQWKKDLIK